jgi:D-specific alpha-keto acid dehydrogenase
VTGTLGRIPAQTRRPEYHGITVYGCEQDEADLFHELGPRFEVTPAITSAAVSESTVISAPGNRCVSVGHKSEITGAMLRALKDAGVEHLSTRSIGVNHIDLRAAARLGITVENAAYAPDGVADYTLMLILMAIRNAKEIVTSANDNDFRLRTVRGKELRDLTVGVVGAGNIGNAVITRLEGFGCRVLVSSDRGQDAAVEFVSLDELLVESDVVTLHLPLNPETHHLIGRREIATMKQGAVLVNTGRGALVDTDALVVALEDGMLGGAALDVLEGEEGLFYFDCTNRPIDNRLLLRLQRLPNVIITPHTAYYTRRALYDTVEQTLIKCREFESSRAHD